MGPYSSTYISSATTTTPKSVKGVLRRVLITEAAAGTITIYDNTSASGTILAVFKASTAEGDYEFNVRFGTGLTIVTAAASKLTVIWE